MLKVLALLFMLATNPETFTEPALQARVEALPMLERVEIQTYEDGTFVAHGCVEGKICDDTPDSVRRTYIINGVKVTFEPITEGN